MMIPVAWVFAGELHIDWFSLAPVRAEVAATILQLFYVFDGVSATRGGHSPHTKWQRYLFVDKHTHMLKICVYLCVYVYM